MTEREPSRSLELTEPDHAGTGESRELGCRASLCHRGVLQQEYVYVQQEQDAAAVQVDVENLECTEYC